MPEDHLDKSTQQFLTRHFTWAICDCCHGHGRVDHPAFANGFTATEWQEMAHDWDAEGESNAQGRYLSGHYDVQCTECGGSGKVKEPMFAAMPREERKRYVQFLREQREDQAASLENFLDRQAERRMGA